MTTLPLFSTIYHRLRSLSADSNLVDLGNLLEAAAVRTAAPLPDFGPNSIFYDIGAHEGTDTEYFLKKGGRVVAVEANPYFVEKLNEKFSVDVRSGRLTLLNVAISKDQGSVEFHIDKAHPELSRVGCRPSEAVNVESIAVPAASLGQIVKHYGNPYCVKIDIEGADIIALTQLFSCGIRPKYLSAECHTLDTVWEIINAGYREFKITEGCYLNKPFYHNPIVLNDGNFLEHSFTHSSCGPVAQDIPGSWLSTKEALLYFDRYGVGWKDLHARWSEFDGMKHG